MNRGNKHFFCRLLALLCLALFAGPACAQTKEYQIKSVFLLNFAQFTEWPTNAFENENAPLVIGVLGTDPFEGALTAAVKDETRMGRQITVQHFNHVEEIQACHILFISRSESKRLDAITERLKAKPILTVSDIDGSAIRGVSVWFLTENNKIHLRINLDSLKEAGVEMSSKVLRVAEVISNPKK